MYRLTLGTFKIFILFLAIVYVSSCGLKTYDEPSIQITGVVSNGNYDVRSSSNIMVHVEDPDLQKVYIDVISDDLLVVDSLVKVNDSHFEFELPWELLQTSRESKSYEIIVTAFNENTFGRRSLKFSAFEGFEKQVWHIMWTQNAIFTLSEDYSTFSSQPIADSIDTLIVTPQYASYLVKFKDRYELRDIKTHSSIYSASLENLSRIAASADYIITSQIVNEQNIFSGENNLNYNDYNGQTVSVMPGRILAKNYQANPEKGYVLQSKAPGVVYFQYPAPTDLIKVFHNNRAEFLCFNKQDRDFALIHDNANYQLLELHQSTGGTTFRANLGSHIDEVVDFASTTQSVFILEKDRIRIINLEDHGLTNMPVMEANALYCDFFGDIPYLITENEVHIIDDQNLETNTIKTTSEAIRGFETLHIR